MNAGLALVADELATAVEPRIGEMAEALAAQHPGTLGVLFYGSCLRETRLDGLMLDFYLIVDDYRTAFGKRWLALANRLLPPNVFPFGHNGLIAKYAVLSLADLQRETGPAARDASTFARFAQPTRLAWVRHAAAGRTIAGAVAEAAPTLLELTLPLVADTEDPLAVWREAFARTYRAELRAERGSRPASIVDADPARYAALTEAVRRDRPWLFERADAHRRRLVEQDWARLTARGKRRQMAKLAKASLTFAGGIDYLAWKINRHAGTAIEISDWQRRHPLLAALTLVPRLLRQGAVR